MISPPEAERYLGRQAFAIWWRMTHPSGCVGWLRADDIAWQRACAEIERQYRK